jgi:hypothetical protein
LQHASMMTSISWGATSSLPNRAAAISKSETKITAHVSMLRLPIKSFYICRGPN